MISRRVLAIGLGLLVSGCKGCDQNAVVIVEEVGRLASILDTVELLQDATAPGTTVFEQKGFDLDSDNNFFYSPFYGGCSCRFGFRVPKDFDRDAARFRITYMEATRRSFPWLVAVREGSAVRTVALYGQAPAR